MKTFLRGKVVLVEGGTGALGSVLAAEFIKNGAIVYSTIAQRYSDQMRAGDSSRAISYVQADVTNVQSVERLFGQIVGDAGRVDIVVNTVGGFVPGKPISDTPVEDWDTMMNLNARSAFLSTREALRRMRGQSYGRIVNISAMTGIVPVPNRAAYAISKSVVSLLSELAGSEMAGSGITVNAVAPSIIDTPANRASMPDQNFSKWVKPESIFKTIAFLCSEAGGAISATTVRAVGGVQ